MPFSRSSWFLQTCIICFFFLGVFYIYLTCITRDVYSGDIGDLVTAAYVAGVPHPPGYPLLTMLGYLMSHAPFSLPVVSKVALISVFSSLIGLVFFFKLSFNATKNLFISLFSTSVLGFSYFYWFYAEVPEVFALSNGLLIVIYYLAFQFYKTKKSKYIYLFAFFTGLSLTNQQAILATIPGICILLVSHIGFIFGRKRIVYILIMFFLGLLPYAYIPIAAVKNPVINWSGSASLNNFIRLVLRKDYEFGTNLVSITQRLHVLQIYFSSIINNYSILIILLCVIGMIALWRKNKILFASFFTGFLLSGPLFIFAIASAIKDQDELGVLERFYIHSFTIFLFFLPYGLYFLQQLILNFSPRKIYGLLFLFPLLAIPILMLRYNFPKNDLSKTHIGGNLAYDILSPLPKNAVLFMNGGDSTTFNTWYFHYVLGFRKDIDIIGIVGSRNEIEDIYAFKFKKKNPKTDLSDFEIMQKAIPNIIKTRRVFAIRPFLAINNYIFIPKDLFFEIINKKNIPEKSVYIEQIAQSSKKLHIPKRESLMLSEQNLITPNISRLYSVAFTRIGNFVNVFYNDPKFSLYYYQKATEIDLDNSVAYAGLGFAKAQIAGMCVSSAKNFEKAIALYPIYKPYYVNLFLLYKTCEVYDKKNKMLKEKYQRLFGSNIEKELSIRYEFLNL